MNTKRLIVLLLIGGIAATGAFASGDKEEPQRPPRWDGPQMSEETITVTGQLHFEDRMHPELESGGREYELLVPRYYAYELDLEEGQTVTVEGYTVEGMPCCEEEEGDEIHLWVTKAVIDGKEYDLEDGSRMGMGPRGGMHPRWGMMGPGRRPHDGRWDDGWGRRR